ncbi:hypothetical protein GGX14DRAFT_608296 [Mycena pura]|uniref:Uncharacterized protein n=1 Tax=Mycena pura TaxID=153505 RepID=A0AAD6VNG8_9AGAR|nr:hypothetical protein GGX14DRAFT_608296 [Mycena pura]
MVASCDDFRARFALLFNRVELNRRNQMATWHLGCMMNNGTIRGPRTIEKRHTFLEDGRKWIGRMIHHAVDGEGHTSRCNDGYDNRNQVMRTHGKRDTYEVVYSVRMNLWNSRGGAEVIREKTGFVQRLMSEEPRIAREPHTEEMLMMRRWKRCNERGMICRTEVESDGAENMLTEILFRSRHGRGGALLGGSGLGLFLVVFFRLVASLKGAQISEAKIRIPGPRAAGVAESGRKRTWYRGTSVKRGNEASGLAPGTQHIPPSPE